MIGHQVEQLGPMPADAKRIGQRQSHFATGRVGNGGGLAEGRLGLRRIPQISFEIGDLRRGDQFGVDVIRTQVRRRRPDRFAWSAAHPGVTKIRQRAVDRPAVAAGVSNTTPWLFRSWRNTSPS